MYRIELDEIDKVIAKLCSLQARIIRILESGQIPSRMIENMRELELELYLLLKEKYAKEILFKELMEA